MNTSSSRATVLNFQVARSLKGCPRRNLQNFGTVNRDQHRSPAPQIDADIIRINYTSELHSGTVEEWNLLLPIMKRNTNDMQHSLGV